MGPLQRPTQACLRVGLTVLYTCVVECTEDRGKEGPPTPPLLTPPPPHCCQGLFINQAGSISRPSGSSTIWTSFSVPSLLSHVCVKPLKEGKKPFAPTDRDPIQ